MRAHASAIIVLDSRMHTRHIIAVLHGRTSLHTHTHLYLHTQSTHLAVAADRSGPWAAAAAVEVSTWMTSLMGPMPAKLSSARS